MAALEARGAQVIGAASIIDRSNGRADVGVKRITLVSLEVPSFEPENCPMCERGEEAIKPGSRKIHD
jgi:orotate phosphoribosyltransferase